MNNWEKTIHFYVNGTSVNKAITTINNSLQKTALFYCSNEMRKTKITMEDFTILAETNSIPCIYIKTKLVKGNAYLIQWWRFLGAKPTFLKSQSFSELDTYTSSLTAGLIIEYIKKKKDVSFFSSYRCNFLIFILILVFTNIEKN